MKKGIRTSRSVSLLAATGVAAFGLVAASSLELPLQLSAQRAQLYDDTRSDPSSGAGSSNRIHLTRLDAKASRGNAFLIEVQSLLKVDQALGYGQFEWDEEGAPPGEVSVHVDLRTQLISVFQGGHEIGTAVILYGAESHMTPLGSFPVIEKNRDYHSRTYDAPMPYSLRMTSDGVAIHGSDIRRGSATHGCVGVPLEFASLLFARIKEGDIVHIVHSSGS